MEKEEEIQLPKRSLMEQHLQTIITAILLALLLWTGNTLLDIKQKVTTLEIQVQVMQAQLQQGVDDRFRGADWRREKEIIEERFKRIEILLERHAETAGRHNGAR